MGVRFLDEEQPRGKVRFLDEASIGDAVGNALPQPLDIDPVSPVGSAIQAGIQTLANPARLAATFQQNAAATGELAAEKLGERGVNPYVSAAAGLATQVATDPLSYVPTGSGEIRFGLKPAKGTPSVSARLREMRSGVPAASFDRLRRDPTAFFSFASRAKKGAAIGAAKTEAGISLGITDDIASLTPENLAKARSKLAVGSKAQTDIAGDLQAAKDLLGADANPADVIRLADINPNKAAEALDAVNIRLNKLERSEGAGSPNFQQWSAIKSHLQNILEEVAPGVREANQEFSRVALRDQFMEPFPVNKNSTFSKIGAFGFTPVASVAGGVVGGAPGAIAGAAIAQGVRSPFITGLETAVRGLADKAIDPILTEGVNLATRRGLISAFITRSAQIRK